MELLAAFVFLLYASQDSLTVKVEFQEGAESVVLPCQYSQVLEEIVTVKWSRLDLNPNTVHQRQEGDDLEAQNQLFKGRTSMRPDALDSGNFSLTLREPQPSDSGNYTCSLIDDEGETTLSNVELQLKASQDSLTKKVEVQWGQSVVLPCQYSQTLEEMVTVKWSRLDLNPNTVHQRREGDDLEAQNQLFKGRTSMRPDALDSGDFSLTLSELQRSDSGNYTCSIIDDEEKETMLSEVQLHVKEIPIWAIVLLVLLILLVLAVSGALLFRFRQKLESARARILLGLLVLLVVLAVSGGLLFHFQHKFKSEIPTWALFVVFLLFFLTIDVGLVLHFRLKFKSGFSKCQVLKAVLWLLGPVILIGILFLIPVLEITFPWFGTMLVLLIFFVSGNLLFHFRYYLTSGSFTWVIIFRILQILLYALVAVFGLVLMIQSFAAVFEAVNFSAFETSTWARIFLILLVLLLLTVDVGLFIHFRQQFISVYKVEVDSGVESVLLPFKTSLCLSKNVKVKWKKSTGRIIHSHEGNSRFLLLSEEQLRQFRDRTEMEKKFKFGDVSLILKNPTERDTDTYTCTVFSSWGKVLIEKKVLLNVRGQ